MPVDRLTSTPHLPPFCLVRKKHRCHPWPWDIPLIPTEFSLMNALEPSSPIPGTFRWHLWVADCHKKKIHVTEKDDALCLAWSMPQTCIFHVGEGRTYYFLPPGPAV